MVSVHVVSPHSPNLSQFKQPMKTPLSTRSAIPVLAILMAVLALQTPAVHAENFVLGASDAAGTSSFNSGLNWSGGLAPEPGNTYQTAAFILRTPQNTTSITFLGDSLEVQSGGNLRIKTAATVTITNLIVAGSGIVELTRPNNINNATAAGTLAGGITLNGIATLHAGIAGDVAGEMFTISAILGGTGGFTTTGSNGRIILTGANPFSGGATSAGLANSTVQLGNADAVSNSVVTIGVNNGLTFSGGIGTFNLGGLAGVNNTVLTDLASAAVTLVVGGNNSSSTYSGVLGGSGGLVKTGTGTQTLSNTNTYAGATTVSAGRLIATSAARLGSTGTVTVNDGATLGVTVLGTNQLSIDSLTLGSGTGATNEFLNVASTSIAPLKTGTLALNGVNRISIASGDFIAGNSYPIIEYTTLAGAGSVALGALPGGVNASLSTVGNVIYLNVTLVAPSIWTGAVNSNWDIATTANWTLSGSGSTYSDGAITEFPNSGANPNVNIVANVAPASVTVSNTSTSYSFNGSAIGGIGGLTKLGSGTLTLNNLNTYAGDTVISNGTVILGAANAIPGGAGKGNLILAAGALDLNTFDEALNGLSGAGTVNTVAGGTPVLTVGGNNASTTFTGTIQNSAGTLALTKIGGGTLTLNNANTYSGLTTIAGGTLVIGAGNPNGLTPMMLTNAGSTLRFATNVNYASSQGLTLSTLNESQTITLDSGVVATFRGLDGGNAGGASIWLGGGGTLRLTDASTAFSGLLRINNAALIIDDNAVLTADNNNLGLQIGSGVVPGAPTNSTGIVTVKGNGQLIQTLQGVRIGSDGNGSTGILNIEDDGVFTTPLIYLPRQGNNTGIVNQVGGIVNVASIQGGNSVTPTNWLGVYNLNGGTLAWSGVFGGGPVNPTESMYLNLNGGLLQFTGSPVIGGWSAINVLSNGAHVDVGANFVVLNDGLIAGDAFGGGLHVGGLGGFLNLAGTNTYTGNTTLSNATLLLTLPPGAVSSISNSPVIQILPDASLDVWGVASGFHVVSGQTLRGNGTVNGPLTVDAGGTLTIGGAGGTPGTLTFSHDLALSGNTVLRINKGGTSDLLTGINTLQCGGMLTLSSIGATLAAGDSFTLFSATTVTGAFSISPLTPGPGLAWDQSQLGSGIIAVINAPAGPALSPPLQDQTVQCGSNATFTAFSTGSSPLYFQWSSNGVPVTGWTTNNPNAFTMANVRAAGSAYAIAVTVTNSINSVTSSATLTVEDTMPPVITVLGASPMTVLTLSSFVDPGATAIDGCEGAVVVTTNNLVDTSIAGTYQVTYDAFDSTGNPATATRTVHVVSAFVNTWTNNASSVWSAATNWLNGMVANGSSTVADFSTIDITNDIAVALDSVRTIAGLTFGDTLIASAAGWNVNNNGNPANVLTLQVHDGTTPTVNVNALAAGRTAALDVRLAGTTGLMKTGAGTLALTGDSTYSGIATVAGGTLMIGGNHTNIGTAFALTNSNTALRFASNANYTVAGGITISDNTANGGETIAVESGAAVLFQGLNGGNGGVTDTWFSGGGTLRLTNSSSTYAGRIRLNNAHLIIDKDAVLTQTSANVASSQIGSGAVPNTPAGSTGMMTVRANGEYVQLAQGLRIGSDGNGATGILNVQDQGSVTVPLLYLPRQSGNTGVVNQVGGTVTTSSIQGGGGGTWQGIYNLHGGTLSWGGTFATGPTAAGQAMVLNLNGGLLQFTAEATVGGWTAINVLSNRAIIDTMGNTVTFTDPLVIGDALGGGLTKLGSGTLRLGGGNTYSGTTVISEGTLLVNGSIAGGAVSANAGTTIGGTGIISGPATVAAGGTLAPGDSSIGTLTFGSSLTLAGATALKLNTSLSPSNDLVTVNGALAYGGTLTVINEGPALVAGDSFKLFSVAGTGSFSITTLPVLDSGLSWLNRLGVDGSIAVVGSSSAPVIGSASRSGTNLILISTSTPNATQRVLSSTNLALPVASWTAVATNAVGADGLFTNTIPIIPGEPQRFFRLSIP
jgi:fibronectin-binding autotransporter adhesin